jgi:peptide/nickel transport system permease protein
MQQYIARRILLNLVVIFMVATMIFGALRIDPDNVVRQRAQGCTDRDTYDECVQLAREELGLDKHIFTQYVTYLGDLVQLDFGQSYYTKKPVIDEIAARAGPSIQLGLMQIVVALAIALPVGIISAIRQDSWMDYLLRFFAIAFLGIPVFVIAVFVMLFSVRYASGTFLPDIFGPQAEYVGFFENPLRNLQALAGPAIIGGLGTGAILMRFLRSQMLEVLRQDYVRTAWAKGLRERVIVIRHALKNAFIPIITLIGILLGSIVSANVILEWLFRIPGLGSYVVSSIDQFDYPVVQGIVLIIAVSLVFINLIVDITYGWLDPRIRYS